MISMIKIMKGDLNIHIMAGGMCEDYLEALDY